MIGAPPGIGNNFAVPSMTTTSPGFKPDSTIHCCWPSTSTHSPTRHGAGQRNVGLAVLTFPVTKTNLPCGPSITARCGTTIVFGRVAPSTITRTN